MNRIFRLDAHGDAERLHPMNFDLESLKVTLHAYLLLTSLAYLSTRGHIAALKIRL